MGDQRFIPGADREDHLDPYGRASKNRKVRTKSLISQAGGANTSQFMMSLGGDPDLSRPYAQHPWVYACVSAISRAASSVPARTQRLLSNGDYETVTNSMLSRTLDVPNPLQSQRKFFRNICTTQMLYGETFLILLRRSADGSMVPVEARSGGGMMAEIEQPDEIWPVRGDLVDAVIDEKTKLPSGWRFQTGGGYQVYPAHAVVQIAEVNPYNPLRGMGPMTAAYRTAAKDFVIDRYDEALLQNGGSPGGVLTVDGPLTDGDQRAIREAWHEAHARPESHRKTAVLPQGTTYKEIGMTPQAMEHEKLRDWDRQTILSIFGVPPVVLGLETINYATAREQNRIFWETTVLPYLDFLKDELQYKLIRRIASPDADLILDFDISGVSALREDMDAKVDRALKLYEKGHRSFIEAAALAGWAIDEVSVEGAEDRWVPMNLAPANVQAAPLPVPDDDGSESDEGQERSEASLNSRASAGTSSVDLGSGPHHLEHEESYQALFRTLDDREDEAVKKLEPKITRVIRDFILAQRKKLREIAGSAPKQSAASVIKFVPTEAEIARLLDIHLEYWAEEMSTLMVPTLKTMMVSGASGAAAEIGAASPFITNVTDPFVVNFYSKFPAWLAETSITTLDKDITRVILKALTETQGVGSVNTIQEAVRLSLHQLEDKMKVMVDQIPMRAQMIARTEVQKAHNGARLQEWKHQGVERHQWVNSGDNNVRLSHRIMETVKVGDPFSIGVTYPCDPSGNPSEIVNCRCRTIPVQNTQA